MGNGMNKVLPGIYLGSIRDAKDALQLKENNITHILSIHENAKKLHSHIESLCISASDSPDQDLSQYFSICNDFIHRARINDGNILIHCLAGVSRSVTVTVAYIMTITNLGWRDALNVVRSTRKVANPNFGFQRQLLAFEHDRLPQERKRFDSTNKPSPHDDFEIAKGLLEAHWRWVLEGDEFESSSIVNSKAASGSKSNPDSDADSKSHAKPNSDAKSTSKLDSNDLGVTLYPLPSGAYRSIANISLARENSKSKRNQSAVVDVTNDVRSNAEGVTDMKNDVTEITSDVMEITSDVTKVSSDVTATKDVADLSSTALASHGASNDVTNPFSDVTASSDVTNVSSDVINVSNEVSGKQNDGRGEVSYLSDLTGALNDVTGALNDVTSANDETGGATTVVDTSEKSSCSETSEDSQKSESELASTPQDKIKDSDEVTASSE